jgi:hypothetical protein
VRPPLKEKGINVRERGHEQEQRSSRDGNPMKVRWISVLLLIIVLTAWAILPFVVCFPTRVGSPGKPRDSGVFVVGVALAILIAMASIASQLRDAPRTRLLRKVAVTAAISTVASFLLGLDIRFPKVEIPIPHVLGHALGVDGELAYDAAIFEIYCELWLCVAGIVGALIFVERRRKAKAESDLQDRTAA